MRFKEWLLTEHFPPPVRYDLNQMDLKVGNTEGGNADLIPISRQDTARYASNDVLDWYARNGRNLTKLGAPMTEEELGRHYGQGVQMALGRLGRQLLRQFPDPDYGRLFWNQAEKTVHWMIGDGAGGEKQIKQALEAVPGVEKVVIGDEWRPKTPGWVEL